MAYDVEALVRDARQRIGGLPALAASIGRSEGGSVQSQHASALAFWESALDLTGADALSDSERALAQAECARHVAALESVAENRYSVEPYRTQPI